MPKLPWAHAKPLPHEIYAELVDLAYIGLRPILIMGVAIGAIGGLIATITADKVLAVLAAAGVAASCFRVGVTLAYRRHAGDGMPPDPKAWERRFGLGSILMAAVLGAFNLRAILVGDSLVHLLVTGLIFGYGAGLVSRQAVRPTLCATSLALSVVPTAAAMASQMLAGRPEERFAYAAQTLLILVFAIASLETMAALYRTTVRHLFTRRSFADLARQDDLTGLPNRLMLRERFEEDARRLRKDGRLIALHFLDLDRFKAVNDQHGHPTGDALLKAVAERLRHMLRAGDTVARLGGDEFVVVQSGIAHPDEAGMLAHRIVRTISAPYGISGLTLSIGTSVGIALAPIDGVDLEQLAARADAALYRAKGSGRGAVAFWSDVDSDRASAAA